MKIEKVGKLAANLYAKKEYVIHINLKQALNHGLEFKKVHRVVKACVRDFLKIHYTSDLII